MALSHSIILHLRPASGIVRVKAVVLLLCIIAGYSCVMKAQTEPSEIIWDHYGVPHIYGKDAPEMFYAFGWAQMTNHADLLLKLYAQARGKASEYWGEDFLAIDKLVRQFELPERSVRFYHAQPEVYKSYLDAFVKGINDYAVEHPNSIGEEFRQVLPVRVEDVISHILRITYLEFLAGEDIFAAHSMGDAGSNALAISPARTSSGKAMLVINPHLPWHDYFLWFESHLNFPGYNTYGISLVGMPSVVMGFNQNLGWTHTINPIDASDRYELKIHNDSFLFDGREIPLVKKTVSIKTREKNGIIADHGYDFWYSTHGPVLSRKEGKGIAVRIAGFDNTRILEEYFEMSRAANFREFENALKLMQIPMFNIIYADKEGNFFYFFNGNIPVRETGDFAFWKGTIDGSKSGYLWTTCHSYNEMPRLLNPSTGFIQNCNDAPWSCTFPPQLNAENYPAYFSTRSFSLRAQRATRLVLDHPSMSLEQLAECKQNTLMEAAVRFREPLIKAAGNSRDSLVRLGAGILKDWDCTTDTTSRGAVLFTAWWDKVNSSMFRKAWDPKDPFNTPEGFKDRDQITKLLAQAVLEVSRKYGAADVSWGEVHRFRAENLDLPANGGPGDQYGLFRTVYYQETADKKQMAMAGETFIAVIEFGEQPRALVSLSYGNATQEGNQHRSDQLVLLSTKKLRPALLTKEQVIANQERREGFAPITGK